MITLICSGISKQYRLRCDRAAVWAIRARTTTVWHGACTHHSHQVMKRLAGEEGELVVLQAATVMAENAQVRSEAYRQQENRMDEALELLRPLVLDSEDVWTGASVAITLAERVQLTNDLGRELLERLCEEGVMEHQGDRVYVSVGHLPASERFRVPN